MTTIFGGVSGDRFSTSPVATLSDFEASFARLDVLAKLLDSAIQIPGTKIVMGFDALLGVVPVIGDAISGLIASYIIFEARRLGALRWLVARMSANTAIDTLVGSIPVIGDVFDIGYKSNLKNVALLKRHAEKNAHRYGLPIDASYTVS